MAKMRRPSRMQSLCFKSNTFYSAKNFWLAMRNLTRNSHDIASVPGSHSSLRFRYASGGYQTLSAHIEDAE